MTRHKINRAADNAAGLFISEKCVARFVLSAETRITSRLQMELFGFKEKAREDQSWINMGYMVIEPTVFDYLGDGSEMLEAGPFEIIVKAGEMNGFCYDGFWSPMDNVHDRDYLEKLWASGNAPWKP